MTEIIATHQELRHEPTQDRPGLESGLTLTRMREAIAKALGEPEASIGDEENLIALGIDSILIMQLVQQWYQAGAALSFRALVERPTLSDWWQLASRCQRAPEGVSVTVAVDEDGAFALAPMQQAYWIGAGASQILGGVNAHYYVELDGATLEPQRLERAVRRLVARHGMLRARFTEDGLQQVMPAGLWEGLTVRDLRSQGRKQVEAALAELRVRLAHRRMRSVEGEVFDVQLSLLEQDRCRLHVNIEMLVCDARSFQIVLRDLASLYAEPGRDLEPISYSFQQYLAEQRAGRAELATRDREYWKQRLAELPGAPKLPLAVDPTQLADQRVGRRVHRIDACARDKLAGKASEAGLTLSTVLATAFAEVIGAWSGELKFLLNFPLFDRQPLHPEADRLVGDFSNLLIVAVDLSTQLPFADQAAKLAREVAESADHIAFSGLDMLRLLASQRPGDALLAPVVFTSALGMGDLFDNEVRRWFGEPVWIGSQTPQVWLDHQVLESEGGLLFNWDVLEALFPAGIIDAIFDAHVRLIAWLVDEDSALHAAAPIALPPEQKRVRAIANDTTATYTPEVLHARFFEHAAQRPNRLALAWGEQGQLSYGELAERALKVAALLKTHGVEPGAAVAVSASRGARQIEAVLGVLAAGAVYVPISVDQPAERRARICAIAGVHTALVDEAATARDWPEQVRVVSIDAASASRAESGPTALPSTATAYIIFTSGSTGVPKAIEMSHAAATNTVRDVNARFAVGQDDRVLALSALEFDLSVYDIFGLLSSGGALVLVDEQNQREPREWLRLVQRYRVTVWNTVPALLDMFCASVEAADHDLPLRLVLASGDWVGLELPAVVRALVPDARFVALGGATEAAIWSNYQEVTQIQPSWRSIPYGRPLANQYFRVADERRRDRPDWVPGELWIGGTGLARGYRGDSALTDERFVEDRGQRWYRTGDQGRYMNDGTLEFLGRRDHQVKIRGHRIELGEVEAVFAAHALVKQAVALKIDDGRPRLAVCVTCYEAAEASELRTAATHKLVPYMVPDIVLVLPSLPLTATGKVDRKALGVVVAGTQIGDADEAPRGLLERGIAELWASVLGLRGVGRGRSFFELGGDSLSAIKLLEAIRRRFGTEIKHRELLLAPTIAELTQVIERAMSTMEEGSV